MAYYFAVIGAAYMEIIFNNPVFFTHAEIFIFFTSLLFLQYPWNLLYGYTCFILNIWYTCPKLALLLHVVFFVSGFKSLVRVEILKCLFWYRLLLLYQSTVIYFGPRILILT
jgi:hypothetical protein